MSVWSEVVRISLSVVRWPGRTRWDLVKGRTMGTVRLFWSEQGLCPGTVYELKLVEAEVPTPREDSGTKGANGSSDFMLKAGNFKSSFVVLRVHLWWHGIEDSRLFQLCALEKPTENGICPFEEASPCHWAIIHLFWMSLWKKNLFFHQKENLGLLSRYSS